MSDRLVTYTSLPVDTLQGAVEKAQGLLAALEAWTDIDPRQAGELLREVHDEVQRLDQLRLEVGKPAREAQKDINFFFRPALDAFKKAKVIIKGRLEAHQKEIERVNREALQAASSGDSQALARVVPAAPVVGVAFRDELVVEVVDIDKVPREFMCVDMSALKILARAGGQAPPGVVFRRVSKAVVGR